MTSIVSKKLSLCSYLIHKNIRNTCTNILRGFICDVRVLNKKNNQKEMSQPANSFTSASNVLPEANRVDNIVWVDMEMTGLDPEKDHVLEVACLVTDSQLNIIAEGPDIAIYQPPEVLAKMNEWCVKHHGESGLRSKCETSRITLKDAEEQLLDFVRNWAPFKRCPLGGNTIYMDRMFLMKHMPEFEQHMHYRIIDVSSVKELCRRWYSNDVCLAKLGNNGCSHRAMDDIKDSVDILKHYRSTIFRSALELLA